MPTEIQSVTGRRTVLLDDGRSVPAVTLDAGEAHLGEVGGRIVRAVPAALPATSIAAYASGDVLGSKMRLVDAVRVNAGSGLLQDLSVTLKSVQTVPLDAFLFRADPTASTFTDNAPFAVAPADFDKVIGEVPVLKVNALGTGCLYEANQLARTLKTDAGRDLWLVLVWRGAATLGSTSDLAAVAAMIAVD